MTLERQLLMFLQIMMTLMIFMCSRNKPCFTPGAAVLPGCLWDHDSQVLTQFDPRVQETGSVQDSGTVRLRWAACTGLFHVPPWTNTHLDVSCVLLKIQPHDIKKAERVHLRKKSENWWGKTPIKICITLQWILYFSQWYETVLIKRRKHEKTAQAPPEMGSVFTINSLQNKNSSSYLLASLAQRGSKSS